MQRKYNKFEVAVEALGLGVRDGERGSRARDDRLRMIHSGKRV